MLDNPEKDLSGLRNSIAVAPSGPNSIEKFDVDKAADWWRDRGNTVHEGRKWVGRKWFKADKKNYAQTVKAHWEWEYVDPNKFVSYGWDAEKAAYVNVAEGYAAKNRDRFIILKENARWTKRIEQRQRALTFGFPLRHRTISRLELTQKIDAKDRFVELDRSGWVQLQIKADGGKVLHGFDDVDENTQKAIAKDLMANYRAENPDSTIMDITSGSQAFRKAMMEAGLGMVPPIKLTDDSKPSESAKKSSWLERRFENNLRSVADSTRHTARWATKSGGKGVAWGKKKAVGAAKVVKHPKTAVKNAGKKVSDALKKIKNSL